MYLLLIAGGLVRLEESAPRVVLRCRLSSWESGSKLKYTMVRGFVG